MWSDANAADLQDNSTPITSSQCSYFPIKNTQQEGISCCLPAHMRRNTKTKNILMAGFFFFIQPYTSKVCANTPLISNSARLFYCRC